MEVDKFLEAKLIWSELNDLSLFKFELLDSVRLWNLISDEMKLDILNLIDLEELYLKDKINEL